MPPGEGGTVLALLSSGPPPPHEAPEMSSYYDRLIHEEAERMAARNAAAKLRQRKRTLSGPTATSGKVDRPIACREPDCDVLMEKGNRRRGLCSKHYFRLYRREQKAKRQVAADEN